jgi:hypothetical protein
VVKSRRFNCWFLVALAFVEYANAKGVGQRHRKAFRDKNFSSYIEMSFAQTTSAEGVPTRLQNTALSVSSLTPGVIVASTVLTLSKTLTISAPLGSYLAIGSVALPDSVPLGNWITFSVYSGATQLINLGMVSPVGAGLILPISFPVTVADVAGAVLDFQVASQAGSLLVTAINLQLIRI